LFTQKLTLFIDNWTLFTYKLFCISRALIGLFQGRKFYTILGSGMALMGSCSKHWRLIALCLWVSATNQVNYHFKFIFLSPNFILTGWCFVTDMPCYSLILIFLGQLVQFISNDAYIFFSSFKVFLGGVQIYGVGDPKLDIKSYNKRNTKAMWEGVGFVFNPTIFIHLF